MTSSGALRVRPRRRPDGRTLNFVVSTLAETIAQLDRRGYTGHFGVRGDQLQEFESGRLFDAKDLVIRAFYRFEGVSDPDDMSIVYAIESKSGVRGTLADAFGVYSNPLVGIFLASVPIELASGPAAPGGSR